jgi:FkbM family methyltransferase
MVVADDLIYDVGFHRGEDTALYLRKGYRVVAFEANPDLVQEGTRRFERELADGRLEIVEGAISDSAEERMVFYKHPSMTIWGTTSPEWAERNGATVTRIEVPVVRFRDHLTRTGTPYFVKIDIEGADRLCLDALVALNARPAMLSIESDKTDFGQLRAELDALERLGFDKFAAVQQGWIGGRVIRTRTRSGEQFSYRFEPESSGGFGDDIDRWRSRAAIERQYRSIFLRYRLLGDHSLLPHPGIHRIPLLRRVLPGWYDTHAAR